MKKSKTRIFINQRISKNIILYIKKKQHHFLKNVLRVKINDEINIFDGITGEWKTKISAINRDNTTIRIVEKIHDYRPSPDIWLIFSPIKQSRMSLAIQKATELGISKIIPCLTEYTNFNKIKLTSLNANAIESAEQCERLDIPKIEKLTNLDDILSNWPKDRKLIFCNEKLRNDELIINKLISLKNTKNKFSLLIGPEGGFSDKESAKISSNPNVICVSLGKRVLRSDTAITVALYCLQEITS